MSIDEVGPQRFRDLEDPEQSAQVSVEAARGLAQQGDLNVVHILRRVHVPELVGQPVFGESQAVLVELLLVKGLAGELSDRLIAVKKCP